MYREALEDIRDLAVHYDAFNSIDGLKSLIDDIANIAVKALKGERWYERMPPNKSLNSDPQGLKPSRAG